MIGVGKNKRTKRQKKYIKFHCWNEIIKIPNKKNEASLLLSSVKQKKQIFN